MRRFESEFVVFSRKVGKKVRWYWKLRAANNEVVARGGEAFNSERLLTSMQHNIL